MQYQEQVAQLQARERKGEAAGRGEEEDMEDILTPDEKTTAERVQQTIRKCVQAVLSRHSDVYVCLFFAGWNRVNCN